MVALPKLYLKHNLRSRAGPLEDAEAGALSSGSTLSANGSGTRVRGNTASQTLGTKRPGSWFGHTELIAAFDEAREYNDDQVMAADIAWRHCYKARVATELFLLVKDDLFLLLDEYPYLRDMLDVEPELELGPLILGSGSSSSSASADVQAPWSQRDSSASDADGTGEARHSTGRSCPVLQVVASSPDVARDAGEDEAELEDASGDGTGVPTPPNADGGVQASQVHLSSIEELSHSSASSGCGRMSQRHSSAGAGLAKLRAAVRNSSAGGGGGFGGGIGQKMPGGGSGNKLGAKGAGTGRSPKLATGGQIMQGGGLASSPTARAQWKKVRKAAASAAPPGPVGPAGAGPGGPRRASGATSDYFKQRVATQLLGEAMRPPWEIDEEALFTKLEARMAAPAASS